MAKNYATSMAFNKTCMLKRDYSYIINGKCLECKFCYKHAVPGTKSKIRMSKMLPLEELTSPSLYKTPITISKYCDPAYGNLALANSIEVARRIIEKGGQVIWKSAKVSSAPAEFIRFPKQSQLQGRVIAADTKTGEIVRKMIAPNFDNTKAILTHLDLYQRCGLDVAISFDPLILGLNDSDLYIIAHQAAALNIKKIIVKQLFATDYFKTFLTSHVGKDCANLLSERVGPFWTYKSEDLLKTMHGVLLDTKDLDIQFSMCGNKDINSLLNTHSNCCLFDNPNAIYDLKFTGKGSYPSIIELKDK